jgi:predicted nucleic-acid-binding Zn-ribbon protein
MRDEEKVYNKLKYGAVFACPKCGSRRFEIETVVTLCDYLELNEDGTALAELTDLSELSPWFEDASAVYCDECGWRVPKRKYLELVRELGDRIKCVSK